MISRDRDADAIIMAPRDYAGRYIRRRRREKALCHLDDYDL